MADVLLKQITGFSCKDKRIVVKQRGDGKTLYWLDNPKGDNITFNLPAGKWTSSNKLVKLKKPLVYICPPLAKPEVERKIKPFKFRIEENPSKVTINFAFKNFADIKCDPKIWKQSIPAFVFVMSHESGHNYYGGKDKDKDPAGYYASETKCDLFACDLMLQNGFNPSQCIWGIDLCLSDSEPAEERKQKVKDWIAQVKIADEHNFETLDSETKSLFGDFFAAIVVGIITAYAYSQKWISGNTAILIGAAAVFVPVLLKKLDEWFKSKENSDYDDDIKSLGQKPSFNKTQYNQWADALEGAMFGAGTDEKAIFSIMEKLKSDTDLLLLEKAFGKRRGAYTLRLSDLTEWLQDDLSKSDLDKINKIFESNGLKMRV